MELISVGAHPYKIKKQNSKMYYTIFTEPYKYFRRGFLQSLNCFSFGNFPLIFKPKSERVKCLEIK